MEGRVLQDLPDVAEEFRIGARAHRAALIGRGAFMNGDRLSPPLRVDRGARQAPKGAHPLQAVGSARGGEAGLTHRLHLLPAKGRPASRRSIFSRRTSPSIVSSPTLALSRAFSSSRSSAGRALSAASPPRRNASRQAESRAAVVPTRGRASPGSRPAKDAGPPPACAGRRTDPAHCDALGPWLRSPYGRPPPKPPLAFVRSSRHPFLHESWINRVSNKTLERGRKALVWAETLWAVGQFILSLFYGPSKVIGTFELHPPAYLLLAMMGVSVLIAINCHWILKHVPRNRFHQLHGEVDSLLELLTDRTQRSNRWILSEARIRSISHELDHLSIPHPYVLDHQGWYTWLPTLIAYSQKKRLKDARKSWKD